MRADLAVLEAGLCASRAQARQLIEAGSVFIDLGRERTAVRKASQEIIDITRLRVVSSEPVYVSRGGTKLLHALKASGIDPKGKKCVDFGQSTGGFTDCLLQHEAKSVVGFDVGHGQLHASLASNTNVVCFEGVNLKDLDTEKWIAKLEIEHTLNFPFELAVADLSFISLRRVLPSLVKFFKGPVECLFLVKPQFELGMEHIGKKGLVKEQPKILQSLRDDTFQAIESLDGKCLGFFACAIRGGDGNQEYFVHAIWPTQHTA